MRQKLKFKNIKKELSNIKAEFIDLKTLDLKGKLHSIILPIDMFNEDLMTMGVGFDSSSYGFTKTEKSDMVLIPDLDNMFVDPFRERKTVVFMSTIHLTDKNRTRYAYDVRYVAEMAMKTLADLKVGTQALFSPEFEFFIFKKAEFEIGNDYNYYFLEKDCHEERNFYHLSSPDDNYIDFKNELVAILQSLGIEIKYHHHEVAVNQHEIETKFNTLLKTADSSVIIKYVVFNLAKKHELFVTFMPKPFYNQAGNGWHVHQFIVDNDENIFFGKNKYGNISKKGLNYISGLLFHSGSLCALTNPSTNSFKRLMPGFEAPVAAIYATSNRNAAVRIPTYVREEETRIEYRPGDATSNPYLNLSALLMAGLDGIQKNLDPEKFYFGPFDHGLPDSKALKKRIKILPGNLSEALDNLEKDNLYLKTNGVFCDELLSQWLTLKRAEIDEVRRIPHPKEFEQYFYF